MWYLVLGSRCGNFETRKLGRTYSFRVAAAERGLGVKMEIYCVDWKTKHASANPPKCFGSPFARRLRMQSRRQHARYTLWAFGPQTHDSDDKDELLMMMMMVMVMLVVSNFKIYESDSESHAGEDGQMILMVIRAMAMLIVMVVMVAISVGSSSTGHPG